MSLIIIGSFLTTPQAHAQTPSINYVTLYAHTIGNMPSLNASRTWGGERAVDVSHDVVFRLSPALGENLQINGGITMTFYLRGTTTLPGTVTSWISELKPDGTEIPVPGTKIDSPDFLTTVTTPTVLGVGIIQYSFNVGSSILLHVQYQPQSKGSPTITWDSAATPTNLRLPAISPKTINLVTTSPTHFGRIFQIPPFASNATVQVLANVTDAIGTYRFADGALQLTAPDGSLAQLSIHPHNSSQFVATYERTLSLSPGEWQVGFVVYDFSDEAYSFAQTIWISKFYTVKLNIVDSSNNPLENASVIVNFLSDGTWSSIANSSGWVVLTLPSTDILGALNLTVRWLGTESRDQLINISNSTTIVYRLAVYNAAFKPVISGVPLPFINVELVQNGATIANGFTAVDGVVTFKRIPAGNYQVIVDEILAQYTLPVVVKTNAVTSVAVPFPHRTIFAIASLAIVGLASVVTVRRKRGKLYPTSFSYFNELTHGGLPEACFVVIAGNSGSGKTVLLNSLAALRLSSAKSIYVTNTEFPDRVRDGILKLGVGEPDKICDNKRLIFIDAYSAIGGGASLEEYSVGSHTDLTALSLKISKCIQVAGPGADVYMDSLNPLMTVLRIDYLADFLQSVAAKVKANGGKYCVTVGGGIESHDLTRLEETADCVVETELQETHGGQRRKLRIKKMRGFADSLNHEIDGAALRISTLDGQRNSFA
jgi:KaiC/GvpD/RAD55 family RecA-like ATPase